MNDNIRTPDVAVIGGSFGGVAAALSAAAGGANVTLVSPTDWIGGQVTNQGVSALDEHSYIETFGGSKSYDEFRHRVRSHYIEECTAPRKMQDGQPLNPGNGWVSRLCFEPRVGLQVLEEMLEPHVNSGRLSVTLEEEPVEVMTSDGNITAIKVRSTDGIKSKIRPTYVLDATEFGDLLPLAGAEYTTGAESKEDTGEAHAGPTHRPNEIQSFTYCFAVEHFPNEDHTIEKPEGYEQMRDEQPFTFEYEDHQDHIAEYRMFKQGPQGEKPFWTYRRIIDGSLLEGYDRDIALINWSGNDYYGANPIDVSREERSEILRDAKRLAKGFLYWLQTDAPRDDSDGTGYPGLKLVPEIMGTEDGLSKQPYIRESRRILPRTRVTEGDIASASNRSARARNFTDSIGIGFYGMDIHSCVGSPEKVLHEPSLPYQIPLGALLPRTGPENLIASCKNIGTTHITNGAYRLHPTEWTIGESAGLLAAHCINAGRSPKTIHESESHLRQFQYRLLLRGVPIAWTIDVPYDDDLFEISQLLYTHGAIPVDMPRYHRLAVEPVKPVTVAELRGVLSTGLTLLDQTTTFPTSSNERDVASLELATQAFESAGFTVLDANSPPTWRDICLALDPSIRNHFEEVKYE